MCAYDTQPTPLKNTLKTFITSRDQYQVPLGCPQNAQEILSKVCFEMMSTEIENIFQLLPSRQLHVQG